MKMIILSDELESSYGFEFRIEWLLWLIAALVSLVCILLISIWMAVDRGSEIDLAQKKIEKIQADTVYSRYQLDEFYTYADSVFAEHAKQTGMLQARMSRLEALGKRLAHMGEFDKEFDFNTAPALGGSHLESAESSFNKQADVLQIARSLAQLLSQRESELKVLESLLSSQKLQKDQYLAGKPVDEGWLSSGFGKRIDPFTGHMSMHTGVDYTGSKGDPIKSVASGIVLWSGNRGDGYGESIDIDNGDGFMTRYAHNSLNLVNIGDVVTKGQVIAQLGSTGKSTGNHVHFEVYKKGQVVDPIPYIYRGSL